MYLVEHLCAGQTLHDAQRDAGAPNTTAGERQAETVRDGRIFAAIEFQIRFGAPKLALRFDLVHLGGKHLREVISTFLEFRLLHRFSKLS